MHNSIIPAPEEKHPEKEKRRGAFEMASVLWVSLIAATLGAAATVIAFYPARLTAQGSQTTQAFAPNRFALEAAEVNVKNLQPSGRNRQKMLFRIDTLTGQVWVLQVAATGDVNPYVTEAAWKKVESALPRQDLQQF